MSSIRNNLFDAIMMLSQRVPLEITFTRCPQNAEQCHEVTAEVEKLLGKVVYTTPTAERFEEKATIVNTNTVTDQGSSTGSSGSTQKWGQY
jgi:hypothetical protein